MSLQYTSDLSELFFLRLSEYCNSVGMNGLDLLGVMFNESGVRANALNTGSGASGLIQFMPQTLKGMGWGQSPEEFRQLRAHEQIPYVRRYFAAYVPKGLDSLGRIYLAVFLPGLLDSCTKPGDVLTAQKGVRSWAYAQNTVLDVDKDGSITLGELSQCVKRNCKGPRWDEIVFRATDGAIKTTTTVADTTDLRTTRGLQFVLAQLGYDPGPIDGMPGAKTSAAVVKFQTDNKLTVDGIVGPNTINAIKAKLAGK